MKTFHAFYSAAAETLVLGSHHVTNDGRKYTALFSSIEQSEMYLWKDKEYVGEISEYGTCVVTNKDKWNDFFNRPDHVYMDDYINEEKYLPDYEYR